MNVMVPMEVWTDFYITLMRRSPEAYGAALEFINFPAQGEQALRD
jgi:hypothetical protein